MSPGWRSGFLQGGIVSWRTRSYREMCEPWSRFPRMDTGSDTAWHRAVWAKRKFWGWDPSANFHASEKWFQPLDKSRFCVELKEKAQALPGLVIYPPKQLEIIFCVKKKNDHMQLLCFISEVCLFFPLALISRALTQRIWNTWVLTWSTGFFFHSLTWGSELLLLQRAVVSREPCPGWISLFP